ncbi:MAG: substrate-binding domain-containing protein, partial [Lachnospiraceae bacterium]|nr:substrate-binding domain-containing protein [Lachnospiraceae bacterium]
MAMLLDTLPTPVEMVIANDDDMALGAIDAVQKKGYELPLVVGINGIKEALENVKMKKMEGTVYNDDKGQARAIMELAYDLSVHGAPDESVTERSIYVDYKLINYDNVQQYIRLKE